MVNSTSQIPDCDSHSSALLDLFISFDASVCSSMAFPRLGKSNHVSFSCDFSSNSSQWFSADFGAAIVNRNLFFCLYQQYKSLESIVKFRQASNCCKRVLEAAKLAYSNNTKESITSQKLGSWALSLNC